MKSDLPLWPLLLSAVMLVSILLVGAKLEDSPGQQMLSERASADRSGMDQGLSGKRRVAEYRIVESALSIAEPGQSGTGESCRWLQRRYISHI